MLFLGKKCQRLSKISLRWQIVAKITPLKLNVCIVHILRENEERLIQLYYVINLSWSLLKPGLWRKKSFLCHIRQMLFRRFRQLCLPFHMPLKLHVEISSLSLTCAAMTTKNETFYTVNKHRVFSLWLSACLEQKLC